MISSPISLKNLLGALQKFTLAAVLILPLSGLQAGASNKSGNPYGNGSFFPDSGSFSAIARGTNGFLGVFQVTTSTTNNSTNALTNSGIASVYAGGEQFTGPAFGTISGSTIAVSYIGTYTYNTFLPTVTYTQSTNGAQIPVYSYSPITINDSVNGQFAAKLQNSYPNQTFSGAGQANAIFYSIVSSNISSTNSGAVTTSSTYLLSQTNVTYDNVAQGSRLTQ